jgi:hypothetical protein
MPGVPDVLLCDEEGDFHFVELKATGGRAVDLRPHQSCTRQRMGFSFEKENEDATAKDISVPRKRCNGFEAGRFRRGAFVRV